MVRPRKESRLSHLLRPRSSTAAGKQTSVLRPGALFQPYISSTWLVSGSAEHTLTNTAFVSCCCCYVCQAGMLCSFTEPPNNPSRMFLKPFSSRNPHRTSDAALILIVCCPGVKPSYAFRVGQRVLSGLGRNRLPKSRGFCGSRSYRGQQACRRFSRGCDCHVR